MLKDKSQRTLLQRAWEGMKQIARFGTPSLVVLNARHLVLTSCVGSA
jgi:hypothetical protein